MNRPIVKGYVTLAAGQIHYREVAGTSPPIVFLHQTAQSSRSYEALLHDIRLPQRLLALDTPGFGESFEPDGWPSMRDYAAWMSAALDVLGAERAHFFGHHTGASLTTAIASDSPRSVLSLMTRLP